jgi:hypothetical protein
MTCSDVRTRTVICLATNSASKCGAADTSCGCSYQWTRTGATMAQTGYVNFAAGFPKYTSAMVIPNVLVPNAKDLCCTCMKSLSICFF